MNTPTIYKGRPHQRIFFHILLITIALVVLSNMMTLGTTYLALDRELEAKDDLLLQSDTKALSYYLKRTVAALGVELEQVAQFPALIQYIQTSRDTELDSANNPWQEDVTQLFSGLIRAKPRYAQMRLIHHTGKELIRVDQYGSNGQLRVVPRQNLQDKSERDYFQAANALPRGEIYFSQVDLNREFGKIAEPRQLVVRAAIPLFNGETDERFGIVIINLALNKALQLLPSFSDPTHQLMVINDAGQYLFHPDPNRTLIAKNGELHNFFTDFPPLKTSITAENQDLYHHESYTIAVAPIPYHGNSNMYLALRSDNADAVKVRSMVIRQTVFILILLLLLAILISVATSRRLARPIELMSKEVLKGATGQGKLRASLPRYASAEFYFLASSLDEASDITKDQQRKLEQEVAAKNRAQNELEEKIALLDNKNRELQQFTYIASHDLQEPLRTVRSFVDVINKKYVSHFDERGKQMMGFIDDASARMQDLVKDLLDYGRIGRDLTPKPINLMQLVQDVEDDLSGTMTSRGAVVEYKELPNVIGLETELRLLFQNLLSNAFKFTEVGVQPKVKITARPVDNGWQFAVCDNGIGIPEEYRDKVFGVFKRLHNRQDYPGTGIGLAHCLKVVKLHGGDIWIEGNAPNGTCVVFTLKDVVNEKNKLDPAD